MTTLRRRTPRIPLAGFRHLPRRAGWYAIPYVACTWTRPFPFRCGKAARFCTSAPLLAAMLTPSAPGSLRPTDRPILIKTDFELGPSENRASYTNRLDERTGAYGHGRKAHSPHKTDRCTSHGAPHRSSRGPESFPHRAASYPHGGG